jgi:hypothetical protein
MIVRIHLRQGHPLRRARGKNRQLALAGGALLIPASLMAYVLGFWRLASDLGVTNEFAIRGVFSHWQLWIVIAVVLHVGAGVLSRYGRGGEFHLPSALTFRFGAPGQKPSDPTAPPDARRAKAS